MVTVLMIEGKHKSVDNVTVFQFETRAEAIDFCEKKNENAADKYYECAEIVEIGKRYDIRGSRGENNPAEIW